MGASELTRAIELSGPDLSEEAVAAVTAVLRGRRLSLGPRLPEFERMVADYVGCQYGVAVNSGTSALHLIVRALGLGEGDEVITTPFSFIASANCLLYERAVPRFVDIDPITWNVDRQQVEAAITPYTRAILGVGVSGRSADWEGLRAIAAAHQLATIEDSCEALGARYRGSDGQWAMAGSLGEASCLAFYPSKQITTGEGGIVVTDREDIMRLCRSLRNQGREEGAEWLRHAQLGYNYRLSDLNCALGIAQMQQIDEILAARRRVAGWYGCMLEEVPGVDAPPETPESEISWFVHVVRVSACRDRRDLGQVMEGLRARGVGCSNYFHPIHLQPFYRERFGYAEGDFPVAERVSAQTIALPFYNQLAQDEVAWVVRALKESLGQL